MFSTHIIVTELQEKRKRVLHTQIGCQVIRCSYLPIMIHFGRRKRGFMGLHIRSDIHHHDVIKEGGRIKKCLRC
jgi:hypothetical protein